MLLAAAALCALGLVAAVVLPDGDISADDAARCTDSLADDLGLELVAPASAQAARGAADDDGRWVGTGTTGAGQLQVVYTSGGDVVDARLRGLGGDDVLERAARLEALDSHCRA